MLALARSSQAVKSSIPFSINFWDLPLPEGRAGKSRLMTRGFSSSEIAKEIAMRCHVLANGLDCVSAAPT